MNTYQDDWTMRMFRIFRDLGRGTQLARRGQILRLKYDSMIVTGAMTNFRWSLTAGQETYCPFGFSLLVKSIQIIYGGLSLPTRFRSREEPFVPGGFELTGSGLENEEGSLSYTGAPPVEPEGVKPAEELPYGVTQQSDATGTLLPVSRELDLYDPMHPEYDKRIGVDNPYELEVSGLDTDIEEEDIDEIEDL